jgi:hypothetical protein
MALGGDQPTIMQYSYGFFDIDCTTSDVRDFAKTFFPALENEDEVATMVSHVWEIIEGDQEDSTIEKLRVSGLFQECLKCLRLSF